jgi:hypothetical protein
MPQKRETRHRLALATGSRHIPKASRIAVPVATDTQELRISQMAPLYVVPTRPRQARTSRSLPMSELHHDVLGRLRNVARACEGWADHQEIPTTLSLIRAAAAEIERLRDIVAGMPTHEPTPVAERWEMKYVVVPAEQLTYEFTTHETEATWQPFAVGQLSDFSRARVWFRRRVPA